VISNISPALVEARIAALANLVQEAQSCDSGNTRMLEDAPLAAALDAA